jgi:hypothetical protein
MRRLRMLTWGLPEEAEDAAVGLLAPSQRYSMIGGEEACRL